RESWGGADFLPNGPNTPQIDLSHVQPGSSTYLIDAALAYHWYGEHFDFYLSAGPSHFGYDLMTEDSHVRGGVGYLRGGAGLALHFLRHFVVGIEAGWYPLELFHYAATEEDGVARFDRSPAAWDAKRFT